mmetsp:Transcript_9788/g.12226  ORF Transcript_9788/g.12226 Transcript_9788/m.12226 type:complete len:305 (-) Transcript_9788:55-969(-)
MKGLFSSKREKSDGKVPKYNLAEAENQKLYQDFREAISAAEEKIQSADTKENLENILLPRVGETSAKELLSNYNNPDGGNANTNNKLFGRSELAKVIGYCDFAKDCLGRKLPIEVEVRKEQWKAYGLIKLQDSPIESILEEDLLVWVHDDEWAQNRFFNSASKEFGLCGQRLGQSKFVSLWPSKKESSPFQSKNQALDGLGLRGYAAFDKPGKLFVVHVRTQSLAKQKSLNPSFLMVPLLYMEGHAEPDAQAPDRWTTADNFQEGTIPGYTQGLQSELVMKTFKLDAKNVQDLNSQGVFCTQLE